MNHILKELFIFAGCRPPYLPYFKIKGCDCIPNREINDHCCQIGDGSHVCCHTEGIEQAKAKGTFQ